MRWDHGTRWRRAARAVAAYATAVLMASGLSVGLLNGVAGAAAPPPALHVAARAGILVDAATGDVLWAKDANHPWPMASVTKLMTLLLAFQALKAGRVSLRDSVPISMEAYRTEGSQIWLEPGEPMTLGQLLTAIAVGSANDASVAVAEYLAGSTGAFVARMNQEAHRLHMTGTRFENPHGLPAANHYSTAQDLARLAVAALDYPELLRLTSQWQDRTIRNGKGGTLWLINQNRLLRTFPGTDGLKTGYTAAARFCLVATARRGSTRLVAVILGAPTSSSRFADATALLTYGFQHFETIRIIAQGDVVTRLPVVRGQTPQVTVVAGRSLSLTLPRSPGRQLTQKVELPTRIGAPVAAGALLGTLSVQEAGRAIASVPLVAQQSVRAVALPELAWRFFWRVLA